MIEHDVQMRRLARIIQSEYREMPGLQLTKPQVRRLWNLDVATCDAVLQRLCTSHVLRLSRAGRYALEELGEI